MEPTEYEVDKRVDAVKREGREVFVEVRNVGDLKELLKEFDDDVTLWNEDFGPLYFQLSVLVVEDEGRPTFLVF